MFQDLYSSSMLNLLEYILPFLELLERNHRHQTSADSTVRVLSLSRFCPDFPENRVRCLSAVRVLSGFSVRCLSVRILSVSILSAVRIVSRFLEKMLSCVCLSGFFLSRSCPLSGFCRDFFEKRLSAVCLSGFHSKIVCPVSVSIFSASLR